ncbi:TonB-dependent receptor [Flavihumibacter sp. R14]|nr:TonB-dependent receptor [Flavihumibacter soli]
MKRIFLLLFVICSAAVVMAQTPAISGTVKSADGSAVSYATVKLNGHKTTTANSSGEFKFDGIVAGTYKLSISATGFLLHEETVILQGGESKEMAVILKQSENSFLKEIVITSRKKEQLKEDFTSAVSVVNTKTIQDLQTVNNNVSDILAVTVPGLGLSSGSSSNWGQTLRGRQVLILVDGVSQSTPLRNGSVDMRTIDPNVIERIEVIKGANSIYGNGAAGGIINYITRTNKNSPKIGFKTELASTGSLVNPAGTIGGRLNQSVFGTAGKLDYTVSGSYEKTGVVKDAEGDIVGPTYGLSNNTIYNAFTKLGYQLNANQRIQLSYNFFSSLEETNLAEAMGSRKDGRKTEAVEGTTPGSAPGTRWNHNGLLKYSNDKLVGQTSLTVNAYLQDFNTLFFYSTQFENGGQSTIQSSKKGIRADLNTPLISKPGLAADITYGLDILNDVTSQPLLDGRTWVPKMDMLSKAPFLQLQGTLFNDLVINGGLRYENMSIGVEDYTTLKPYNAQTKTFGASVDVKGGEIKYNNLVFNSGLRYNRYDFFKPYVNFSQGFSVADLGLLLRAARVNDISVIQTEPVIINNYEAGFASEFKAFRFEASAYISKSELGSSFIEQDGFYVIARQPERVHGFELAADFIASKNLTLGASYSYVEGKRDGNNNDKYNDTEDTWLGGERIAPPKYTAYLNYTPVKKWNIRTDFIASGARERFAINPTTGMYKTYEGKVDSYNMINLSSSFSVSQSTKLKLGIENLLNADYFPSRSLWPSIDQYYVKGRGMSFTLGVSAQF